MEKADFSLHNLRSGDASAAANAGVNDRLFKCHGRSSPENAKDGDKTNYEIPVLLLRIKRN